MKRKFDLPPVKAEEPKSDETRWFALDVVSSVISGMDTLGSKNVAFTLCRAWAVTEPPQIPHPREEGTKCDEFLDKMELVGDKVTGETKRPLQFHHALLAKYAFAINDGVLDKVAWATFKRNLSSLGPRAWNECEKKLQRRSIEDPPEEDVPYPFPVFLQRVSEGIQLVCTEDTRIFNELYALTSKRYSASDLKYRDESNKRQENTREMKKWSSFMALFYCLCEAVQLRRWSGLDVVAEFFQNKIGGLDALERYCQVLDVETATYRMVEWDSRGRATKLEYVLDDTEEEHKRDPKVSEEEVAWWDWVEKVCKELCRRGVVCDEVMYERLSKILLRIDRSKNKNPAVLQALNNWHKNCRS